jgi:renalase
LFQRFRLVASQTKRLCCLHKNELTGVKLTSCCQYSTECQIIFVSRFIMIDVAVIGAGVAGLTCAQQLRGLGGRLATRRLPMTHADHGVRCLEVQGELTQALIQRLLAQGRLQRWADTCYEISRTGRLTPLAQAHPRYATHDGLTSVAKFLGQNLVVWRQQRAVALAPTIDRTWAIEVESNDQPLLFTAKVLVIAIPAPQALTLLAPLVEQGLPAELLAALRSVTFEPCITAIATYPATRFLDREKLSWQAAVCPDDPQLAWIAVDSSKQVQPHQPTVVIQSTASFAQAHLETIDLPSVGAQLIEQAAQRLPWLAVPDVLQVHRWRYARVARPLLQPLIHTPDPLPLLCGGDWCGGANLESALRSGMQCAAQAAGYLAVERRELTDTETTATNFSFEAMLAQLSE